MKGLLDDAYALAEKLRDTLDEAEHAACEAGSPRVVTRIGDLSARADDLAAAIDLQRSALRGS